MSTHTVNPNTMSAVPVAWEPCGAYDADHECEVGTCVRCGWPGAEHHVALEERAGARGTRVRIDDRGYAHAA